MRRAQRRCCSRGRWPALPAAGSPRAQAAAALCDSVPPPGVADKQSMSDSSQQTAMGAVMSMLYGMHGNAASNCSRQSSALTFLCTTDAAQRALHVKSQNRNVPHRLLQCGRPQSQQRARPSAAQRLCRVLHPARPPLPDPARHSCQCREGVSSHLIAFSCA